MSYVRLHTSVRLDEKTEPVARIISDPADEPLADIRLDMNTSFGVKDAAWCRKAAAAFTLAADLIEAAKQATP